MALLTEKAAAAGLAIEKAGLPNPPTLRVAACLDASGSMSSLYSNGTVQQAFDQLLGAGLKLDDNGEIDTWLFDKRAKKIDTADPNDFGTFVKKKALATFNSMGGGTHYAPAIEQVHQDMLTAPPANAVQKGKSFLSKLFGGGNNVVDQRGAVVVGGNETVGAKSDDAAFVNEPVLAFFLTDGVNDDEDAAMAALTHSGSYPIFWIMVGIGGSRFSFLERAASKFSYVDFVQIGSLAQTDAAMYSAIFTPKFATWAKKYPPATKK